MGKTHNQNQALQRHGIQDACEACGHPMNAGTSGCYEVTMITRIGPGKVQGPPRRVLWRLCSIVCVELFARGHAHLDTALGGAGRVE